MYSETFPLAFIDTFDVRFWGPAVAAQKAKIKAGGSITLTTGKETMMLR